MPNLNPSFATKSRNIEIAKSYDSKDATCSPIFAAPQEPALIPAKALQVLATSLFAAHNPNQWYDAERFSDV
jgi:hypothetical protein